jgi:hypothetical protein
MSGIRNRWIGLVARLRGWSIDDELLAGRSADGDPVVTARVRRLGDRRHRAAVAAALRGMLERARQYQPGRPEAPVRLRQVLELEPLFRSLADEVEADEQVSTRGVILADRLIRDGTSPVYWRGDMSISAEAALRSLEVAVRHARSALHLG